LGVPGKDAVKRTTSASLLQRRHQWGWSPRPRLRLQPATDWTSPSALPYYEIWCDSLALRSNERQLSLSGNDTQYFELDAGPAHANAPYLLLGSLSGISPGLPLGRCTLPLNPDPYLLFSITAPNTTLLPGGLGVLDAQGKASARFVAIPGLPPSFAGASTTPSSPSTARAPPSAATGSRWCSRSEEEGRQLPSLREAARRIGRADVARTAAANVQPEEDPHSEVAEGNGAEEIGEQETRGEKHRGMISGAATLFRRCPGLEKLGAASV
jgi:hypothetical protein